MTLMTLPAIPRHALPAIADRANQAHRQARSAAQDAVRYAADAGRALLEAKASISHGRWGAWLSENVEFSDRTARLYMRLAQQLPAMAEPNRQRVADLSLREAAKEIAAPKRPPKACAEVGELMERYRQLSHRGKCQLLRWLQGYLAGKGEEDFQPADKYKLDDPSLYLEGYADAKGWSVKVVSQPGPPTH